MFSFLSLAVACWTGALLWFAVVQKPLFGWYNRRSSAEPLTLRCAGAVYRHGFVSDAIVASYLAALPLLTGAACTLLPGASPHALLTAYNMLISLALGLLVAADTALYRFWQYKIDASVFMYLRSIKGATASVSTGYLVAAAAAWLVLAATCFACLQTLGSCSLRWFPFPADGVHGWGCAAVFGATLLGAGLLFVVIRGLGIRPHNPSVVYFSSTAFLNHWALNPGYSMIYSLTTRDEFKGRFRFFDEAECRRIVEPLFPTTGTPQQRLLKTDRPNILLVIWESCSADFSGAFGGRGVLPCMDALAAESICFTECVAGSFRTDRGLVCLLSGYPAQPTSSIIRYTRKLPNLPGLARTLRAEGYATVAIHGGDLATMHKSDYYLASGNERLLSQTDYPASAPACKWGIHDGYMMERTADEVERLAAEGRPFFATLQTLSSHEPFAVPYSRLADPIDNAFAYTDHSLGALVERLKRSPAWENLLLIVVADHGLNVTDHPVDRRAYAHIPLLWTGGAIRGPQQIGTLMSQTDLAATLLGQLGIDHRDFTFSRDVLADTYTDPFGLHIFANGLMFVDAEGHTIYDTIADKAVEGGGSALRLQRGKAILQALYADIDNR